MKKKIGKLGAAKSQLLEAINLFFEDRDPVSIHTLVAASLEILNDHVNDISDVWDNNLALHRDSIYIKDEYRKQWVDSINRAKNFFKHADRDLKNGVDEIEFDPDVNEFFVLEAIRRLQLVEKDVFVMEPEFKVFYAWLMRKRPNLLKEDRRHISDQLQFVGVDSLQDYRGVIAALKNPKLFEEIIRSQA